MTHRDVLDTRAYYNTASNISLPDKLFRKTENFTHMPVDETDRKIIAVLDRDASLKRKLAANFR